MGCGSEEVVDGELLIVRNSLSKRHRFQVYPYFQMFIVDEITPDVTKFAQYEISGSTYEPKGAV